MDIEDLKQMSIEELQELQKSVQAELDCRQPKEVVQNVIYTHDCFGSSAYHFSKRKHWNKLLTSIDSTKTTAFAFVGDWLQYKTENNIPVGSYVVECVDGSLKLYKVTGDHEKELLAEGTPQTMISFIRDCKEKTNL